ncbi:hypothetical protein DFH08DRAFT_798931 [Mycena albidolilacea]|uniref:Uncharacterized protein n=1 Tax=Mycena albidolilacea TaxID=1033008 RepID=A0AAD7APP4_9AGAR|nr:hypothetical protein DFH08DRAFT_823678 [Mycena albidolilacea]KAJ7364606.1 hypothetical protein DFH08DRAFT_798931 [Mycena albidolilacea]
MFPNNVGRLVLDGVGDAEDYFASNGTALFKMAESPPFLCNCDPSNHRVESVWEAESAVPCNDRKWISDKYEKVAAHYRNMSEISEWVDMWEPIQSLARLSQDTFPSPQTQQALYGRTSSIKYHNQIVPIDMKLQRQKNVVGLRGLCGPNARFSQALLNLRSITLHPKVHPAVLPPRDATGARDCGVNESPFPLNEVVGDAYAQSVLSRQAEDRNPLKAVHELEMSFNIRFAARL